MHTTYFEDAMDREAHARRTRLHLTLTLAIVSSTIVLLGIGTWTYSAVEESLRGMRATELDSMLDAQTKTLEVWIDDQKLTIKRLARNPEVRAHVIALANLATRSGSTPDHYCAAPARRPLVDQLDDAFAGSGAVIFNVVDRSERIIASKFPSYCGLKINAELFARELVPVFNGDTVFTRPYGDDDRLDNPSSDLPLTRPAIWIETPVFDDAGNVIAALGVGRYAHEQFAAILAAARGGETSEVYAFDRGGRMLSESRFVGSPVMGGDFPSDDDTTSELVLRPPGTPRDTVTRLVESARAGADAGDTEGMIIDPYPGYYGAEVVGAWRWLPARDFGLAVEMSAAEAYAPLDVLRFVFGVVFGALVVAVIAALLAWFWAAKLRSETKRRVGAYILGDRIGEGGSANIYLASHDLLKRPTAVKLLKPTRATDEMVARFQREAQLASQLTHPNTVEIFDYGLAPDGTFYYAMEYLEGKTIGHLVDHGGAMPVARAIHLLRQVSAALAEAHGKGLVHRDISVSNIMVCRYGGEYDFVKILDFGLVKNVSAPHTRTITRTMRIIGTPLYMAPERLRDPADVDNRADIYAVGAVAFFMLTGRDLFDAKDELSLTSLVLNEVPPRASNVATQEIPVVLDDLVALCLAKRREDRPASITDVIDVLDALAHDLPWTQREAHAAWLEFERLEEAPPQAVGSSA